MTQAVVEEAITISVPRSVAADIAYLSADLNDRMHALLQRNGDGLLGPAERAELETLVRMSQFGQIVAMALGETATS